MSDDSDAYGREAGATAYPESSSPRLSVDNRDTTPSDSESTPRNSSKTVSEERNKDMENTSSSSESELSAACFRSHRIMCAPPPPAVVSTEIVSPMTADFEFTTMGATSNVSLQTLEMLSREIPWPLGVELLLPSSEGTSMARYRNCLVVNTYSLEAGFRLPIPPHYCAFLNKLGISPVQLFSNAWRFLAGYTMRCHCLGIKPTAEHMLCLFTVRSDKGMIHLGLPKLNVIDKPSNVGKWKKSWFLVRDSTFHAFNCRIYPSVLVRAKKPGAKVIESAKAAFKNRRAAPDHKKLVTALNLERAGLSLPLRDEMVSSKFLKKGGSAKGTSRASSSTNVPNVHPEITNPTVPSSTTAGAPTSSALITPQEASRDKTQDVRKSQEIRTKKREDREIVIAEKSKKSRTDDHSMIIISPNVPRSSDGIDHEGTSKYGCRAPSSPDLRQLTIPEGVCVEEAKWADTLPATASHYEMMRHVEMMRVHLLSSWKYSKQLEMQCRGLQGISMKADLNKAREEILLLKGNLTATKAERDNAIKAKKEAMKEKENAIKTKEEAVKAKEEIQKAKEESDQSKALIAKSLEDQKIKCRGLAEKSKELIAIYEGRLKEAKNQEANAIDDAIKKFCKTDTFKEFVKL